jgi:alpha-ketoglutarate-dependent 2,4-dichlorophenoxyacetate dioxygenase
MNVTFHKLHLHVGAEVSAIDLRQVHDRATLEQLRAGMDAYGVLVFRNQPFTDQEQLDFAQRFDGQLHAKTGVAELVKNRFGNHALGDISNVDAQGNILKSDDRRRSLCISTRGARAIW